MRRKAAVDANQPEIVAAFRKLGFSVHHTHQLGSGFPDIIISKNGFTALVEIKDGSKPPSKRKLTPDEQKFHDTWQGRIFIVESLNDVLNIASNWPIKSPSV